jgi:iron complex outermembrane receptor protein
MLLRLPPRAIALILAVLPRLAPAQADSGLVTLRVTSQGRNVVGATVASGTRATVTDRSGLASLWLHVGPQILRVTRLGFTPESLTVNVDGGAGTRLTVELREAAVELATTVVSSTRTERRVADEPTRVEVVDREDVEEQIGGSPGVIAELLTESGGVRVQRASAGSSGASVRVRGMRGRYTKILSDGLPLFGVTTEGLGTLQIPPIDLARVEVIKGVASALYGPTALGGVVNLVSEHPTSQPEFVLNETSAGQSDAVLWQTRTLDPHWGYTLVAGAHQQDERDTDKDSWADFNGYKRFVVRPRLFWSDENGNSWFMTTGLTNEERSGGTVAGGVLPNGQSFPDDADTQRGDVGTVARVGLGERTIVSLRGSATRDHRTRRIGGTLERYRRNAQFGEVALTHTRASQVLVAGAAVERDAFTSPDVPQHDYTTSAPALFAEHTWSPVHWFGVSSSARADFHSKYGDNLSPRISLLFRAGDAWNARLSAGSGFYAPTPFTEETEAIGLSGLLPLQVSAERAAGVSMDIGGQLGPVEMHGAAHVSAIRHPLALQTATVFPFVQLVNASAPTHIGGAELYARYRRDPVHFTASYTYIDATELDVDAGIRRTVSLNPRHAAGLSGVYERERDAIVGFELYYTGRQSLDNDPYRTTSVPYVTIDALIQKQFGRLILFVHGEDLNNARQTHYDPLLRPAPDPAGRWTTDVWAPLEGRVVNAGLRYQY